MVKICFDLDGVVRDFAYLIEEHLKTSLFTYEQGKVIYDIIELRPYLLKTAKQTCYCNVIKEFFKEPHFISKQPATWRAGTTKWVEKHFENFRITFVNTEVEKLAIYKNYDLIVEDYPSFPEELYEKIILILWNYNKHVTGCYKKIKTSGELSRLFRKLVKE